MFRTTTTNAPTLTVALIRQKPCTSQPGCSENFGRRGLTTLGAQKEDLGRPAYPTHPTQMPGTATFSTRCGDAAALGG